MKQSTLDIPKSRNIRIPPVRDSKKSRLTRSTSKSAVVFPSVDMFLTEEETIGSVLFTFRHGYKI
jgi:hypothetical protein